MIVGIYINASKPKVLYINYSNQGMEDYLLNPSASTTVLDKRIPILWQK